VDKAGLQRLLFDFINIGNNKRNYNIKKVLGISKLQKGIKNDLCLFLHFEMWILVGASTYNLYTKR